MSKTKTGNIEKICKKKYFVCKKMPPKAKSKARSKPRSPAKKCRERICYSRKRKCRSKSKSPPRKKSSSTISIRSGSPLLRLMSRLTPQAQAQIIARMSAQRLM